MPNYYQNRSSLYGNSKLFPNGFGNNAAGQRFWDQNQAGAFTRWLSEKGVNQHSKFGQWAGNQQGDIQKGYIAALGDNPELSFYGPQNSYLNTIDLQAQYRALPFQQRGDQPSLYATRARRLPRGQ